MIFDDRGNPMSPSHANKNGVRYRYYVSQALLQHRKAEAGSISRVSAPDIEALVCKAVKDARGVDQVTAQTDDGAPTACKFARNSDPLRGSFRVQ